MSGVNRSRSFPEVDHLRLSLVEPARLRRREEQGAIGAHNVRSITLEDIELGGPRRVAEILGAVSDGAFVVVNATGYADLDIVVLGLPDAEERGRSAVYRAGPSFPRALAGLEPQGP